MKKQNGISENESKLKGLLVDKLWKQAVANTEQLK